MAVTIQVQNYSTYKVAHPELPSVNAFAAGVPGSRTRLFKQVNADDYSDRYDILAARGVRVLEDGTARPGSIVHAAGATVADTTHIVVADTDAPGFTLVLPDVTVVGAGHQVWVFMRVDGGGDLTVDGDGAQTVLGAATQVLTTAGQSLALVSDGVSAWVAQ